jgi:hypothetical protein
MVCWGYWSVRLRRLVELVVVVVRDDVVHLLCQTLNLDHRHDLFVVAEGAPYVLGRLDFPSPLMKK